MVQPIRPHDASGIYRREVSNSEAVDAASTARRGAPGASKRADRVTLSEGAREFARLMQAVQEAPDVRADRVADLKSRIESGSYQVDHNGLAALLADRGFAS
jgi:negative regulator of flagellin synthesis FlgM